jgi:hypothetical protein
MEGYEMYLRELGVFVVGEEWQCGLGIGIGILIVREVKV